jgi:hypothetical protein
MKNNVDNITTLSRYIGANCQLIKMANHLLLLGSCHYPPTVPAQTEPSG